MTSRQKVVVWLWVISVAAMGLFPPWAYDQLGGGDGGGDTPITSGYRFILSPQGIGRIDGSRLLVQCAVATVIAAGLFFAWPFRSVPAAPAKP